MINKAINGIKYWGQLAMLPVYWLSFVTPRSKHIWLFGSTFGSRFADNPRYLYLYATQHRDEIYGSKGSQKKNNSQGGKHDGQNAKNSKNTKNRQNARNSKNTKNLQNAENSKNTKTFQNVKKNKNAKNIQEVKNIQNRSNHVGTIGKRKKLRPIWISHSKAVVKFLTDNGYESYYHHSFKGIWYCLRGSIYIFDNYSKDISFWLSGGAVKFNLWHGSGNKKTNYDNKFDKVRHPKNLWEKFKYFPRRLSDEKPHHYTLATSPMMAEIFTSAFHTSYNHIIQDGYPRNDMMFDTNYKNLLTPKEIHTLKKIKKAKEKGNHILIYMPTFRNSEELFFKAMDLERFNAFLRKNKLCFFTKLHPKSKLKEQFASVKYSNILNIDTEVDPYTFIRECDLLVTDYSSIYSDYLMLNRPSVLFPYDFEEYSNDTRECYFEYEDYMPEIRAYTMEELMTDIKQVLKNDTCEEGRLALRDRIFTYADGKASESLCRKIKQIL